MKLFRLSGKPGSGEEERQLVLDTDVQAQAAPEDEPPIGLGAAGVSDNEAEESTATPELDDIPIQELLSDLVGVSRSLGIAPRPRALPTEDQPSDIAAELGEEESAAEPEPYGERQQVQRSLAGYRRYALPGLLVCMAVAGAVGGFMGAEWLLGTGPSPHLPDQSQAGYSKPAVVIATVAGVAPGHQNQAEITPEPSPTVAPEPSPEAAPEPTPELPPTYFLYTVQPGDSLTSIADLFGISLDYILWNNPDIISHPDVVVVGDQLLIPGVDGMIYRVRPGDTLSAIAALYQIDIEAIVAFVPNGLTSPDNAIQGMVLVLPGAVPPLLSGAVETVEPTAPQPEPTVPQPEPTAPQPEPTAPQPDLTVPQPDLTVPRPEPVDLPPEP